jgi:toxin-antitoxin system PIN domain toxin
LSHLLDVNFIVACGWESHAEHGAASEWLRRARSFATCSITEMGFLRVSLSPAYGASFRDAIVALRAILESRAHRFLRDNTHAISLPQVATSKDVTDAHLIHLARRYHLKLATFDAALCRKDWARGVAENPLDRFHSGR